MDEIIGFVSVGFIIHQVPHSVQYGFSYDKAVSTTCTLHPDKAGLDASGEWQIIR